MGGAPLRLEAGVPGRHQPFITGLESGQRRIHVVELLDLAEAIGFDPHELLDELMKTSKESVLSSLDQHEAQGSSGIHRKASDRIKSAVD